MSSLQFCDMVKLVLSLVVSEFCFVLLRDCVFACVVCLRFCVVKHVVHVLFRVFVLPILMRANDCLFVWVSKFCGYSVF